MNGYNSALRGSNVASQPKYMPEFPYHCEKDSTCSKVWSLQYCADIDLRPELGILFNGVLVKANQKYVSCFLRSEFVLKFLWFRLP